MSYLVGNQLSGGYDGADILAQCNISADKGQITVIVGPNGAGKSTVIKALFGLIKLNHGSVTLDGMDITDLAPQERVKLGMALVPQTNNIFPDLTVRENLEMGAFLQVENIAETINNIFNLFPVLRGKQEQPAGQLSGGQRQQVAVGRALMTKPKVLMLDEPTAGMSPIVMGELFDRIIEIKKSGVAILMVEQNARQALSFADIGYVLVTGKNKYVDSGKKLLADPDVRRSFLGG